MKLIYTTIAGLVFTGCGNSQPDAETPTWIHQAPLNEFQQLSTGLTLVPVELGLASDDPLKLTLIGESRAPTVEGEPVMASAVTVHNQIAYVSYMYRAAPYRGAIQMFDVNAPEAIVVLDQIASNRVDVNAIYASDDELLIGGATDLGEGDPAFIYKFDVSGGTLATVPNQGFFKLPSYATTSLVADESRIFVTTGDQAGLSVLNRETFAFEQSVDIFDARSVTNKENLSYIFSGQPGTLTTYDHETQEILSSVAVGGASTPEDKGYLYVGASASILPVSDQGFKVICLADGKEMASVSAFNDEEIGDSPNYAIHAAVVNQYAFIASGGYAIQIYDLGEQWDEGGCEELDVEKIGHFTFADDAPVTHLHYENGLLYVAAGESGLKIVSIEEVVDCGDPIACAQQKIADACKSASQTMAIDFEIPKISQCEWGTNGNLSAKNGYIRAHKSSSAEVELPEGAILCGINKFATTELALADDLMALTWNNAVLASNIKNMAELLPSVSGFHSFDWSALSGRGQLKMQHEKFCHSDSSCEVLPHDRYGDIAVTFSDKQAQDLMVYSLLADKKSTHQVAMIAIGDDDKSDCQLKGRQKGINFSLEVEIVIPVAETSK